MIIAPLSPSALTQCEWAMTAMFTYNSDHEYEILLTDTQRAGSLDPPDIHGILLFNLLHDLSVSRTCHLLITNRI